MLTLVGIAPHPPIIIPEIGRAELGKAMKTVKGMRALGAIVADAGPECLIIITPHGPVHREGPTIQAAKHLNGSFARFGYPDLQLGFETDIELLEQLKKHTLDSRLKPIFLGSDTYRNDSEQLDHGALVPLFYLREAGIQAPGLHITFGFNENRDQYHFGQALRRAIEERGLKTVIIASGDLSHRLIPGAPAGYSKRGAEYDQQLVNLIAESRTEEIINMDSRLVEEAGECGLRSLIIALGTLGEDSYRSEIISYEGPFGVGYLVAALRPTAKEAVSGDSKSTAGQKQVKELNPAHFARKVLELYFKGETAESHEGDLPEIFSRQAGTFVSLKKKGALRGCIGTFEPTRQTLAEEIKANAISAALKDPRFAPLKADELNDLDIAVDVLGELEKVENEAELNPKEFGIYIRSGYRSALLLPDLEGVDTVGKQLEITRQKAGIGPSEPIEIYRFQVTRYKG